MGRSVFAQKDGVVGEDIEDTSVGKGTQDGSSVGISNKVEEGGTERNYSSMSSKAIGNGSHGMLSDSETDVTLAVSSLLEIPKKMRKLLQVRVLTYRHQCR